MRELDCQICEKPVKIRTKEDFLHRVREGSRPICGQCRRYVGEGSSDAETTPTSRVIELEQETDVTAMALVRKTGQNAKKTKPLASRKLRRVASRGCDPCREND